MFCVLFEVEPRDGQADTYFRLAVGMRKEVEKIDGFLTVERFADTGRPGAFLSFSTWRDEKALIRWRVLDRHQIMQARGRTDIFADYRIRIGELVADSAMEAAPAQFRFDETETGDAKLVTVSEHPVAAPPPQAPAAVSTASFHAVLTPERAATLTGWPSHAAAAEGLPEASETLRHRHFRIVRDYTMRGRHEAPQYFPP